MEDLLTIGAAALRKAALNEEAKEYLLSNPALFATLRKAADRYIGGATLEETILKIKQQNAQGFKCSIEFMGESTRTVAEADAARDEFVRICQEIGSQGLNATVSLDLSHIGLAISQELCLHNLNTICDAALQNSIEVIISAEGTDRTDAVLAVYTLAARTYGNLAITLQAYLHRTQDDFEAILALKGRIRIVKGAFETPAGLSLSRGAALDEAYLGYIDRLLAARHLCSIATHHDAIQQKVKALIQKHKADPSTYEFESLYGIQNEQLQALKAEGYPTKVYFVYGKEWYLYLCNRLAEYPLNLFRALNDIVG